MSGRSASGRGSGGKYTQEDLLAKYASGLVSMSYERHLLYRFTRYLSDVAQAMSLNEYDVRQCNTRGVGSTRGLEAVNFKWDGGLSGEYRTSEEKARMRVVREFLIRSMFQLYLCRRAVGLERAICI